MSSPPGMLGDEIAELLSRILLMHLVRAAF